RPPPTSQLFPYTTLFRSRSVADKLHRKMIFTLFPYPRRLKALLVVLFLYSRSGLQWLVRKSGALGLLPSRLAQLDALMPAVTAQDRKSTRLNSSHVAISY